MTTTIPTPQEKKAEKLQTAIDDFFLNGDADWFSNRLRQVLAEAEVTADEISQHEWHFAVGEISKFLLKLEKINK